MNTAITPEFVMESFPLSDIQFSGYSEPHSPKNLWRNCIIKTKKIAAAPFRYQLCKDYPNRILDMMTDISAGNLDLNILRPQVEYLGGLFLVVDGRKRITAAKALGIEEIPVEALYTEPTSLHVDSFYEYLYFRSLEKMGLFKVNKIDKPWVSGSVFGSYARFDIATYKHVSVFVEIRDMLYVKKVFDSLGASGVSSLEEFNALPGARAQERHLPYNSLPISRIL